MKYQKRYNKFSFETNCRICLTQSTTRYSLERQLKGSDVGPVSIQEALEVVTNQKVLLNDNYPNTVCGMCFELLKISYDFVQQYKSSMEKLREQFGEVNQDSERKLAQENVEEDAKRQISNGKHAPVEILVGNEKFNIKDILIVEEDTEESPDFQGFLKNLGKAVSASFVKKDVPKTSIDEEEPSLVIEKIVHEPVTQQTARKLVKMKSTNVKKLPNNIALSLKYNKSFLDTSDNDLTDNDFLVKENCNTEVYKNLKNLPENEKNALKSALNFKYKCPHCNKFMATLTRAKMHSKRCLKGIKNPSCNLCDKIFESRRELLLHMKKNHYSVKPQKGELDDYICKICNKIFWSKGGLAYHLNTHIGKRHMCDKCSKHFYTRAALKTHMQVHSREKTVVVCPICGKGFHYRGGLFYHLKIHRNERNLQCIYCPRKFYTTTSLKRHELTHTGARPYACQYCDKSFRSKGEMKKHEWQHTNVKPYTCNYCSAGFRQMYNKNMHMMTHGGDFRCSMCGRGFADKNILSFHLKTKHGIKKPDQDINDETNTNDEPAKLADDPSELEDDLASQYIQIEGEETLQFDGEEYYITEYIEETENETADALIVSQMNAGSSKGETLVETIETFE
ncbi:zinc finger protein 287-like isoform X2 [Anthonomus grandis grandis]|uniref:zinc finger protein 287-like isoform X2 n=1 Tax=Anthonomus grandis grandis TaxID=2921223 RepID=UPI0021664539|nr:zinc finger protein 287-like isoform X2 [Anthonomus grandis grandis]